MKRAAIGIRVHSGWGALLVVSGKPGTVAVIDRRRIVITDPKIPGANQPYHFAQKRGLREAEKYRDIVEGLHAREYRVAGSAILLASGRPLGSLPEILASHALIHTAEGEFFRRTFRIACEGLGIPVAGFRERELEARAKTLFGGATTRLQREIANLGRALGSPWTKDQKTAALAAEMVLASATGE